MKKSFVLFYLVVELKTEKKGAKLIRNIFFFLQFFTKIK